MSLRYFILDADNHIVPCDLMTWARWFEGGSNRRVGSTQVTSQCRVSTVFLGLDHRLHGDGPPIVFETMIFGGPLDGEMWRYSSYDDAETGHKAAVRKARVALKKKVKP